MARNGANRRAAPLRSVLSVVCAASNQLALSYAVRLQCVSRTIGFAVDWCTGPYDPPSVTLQTGICHSVLLWLGSCSYRHRQHCSSLCRLRTFSRHTPTMPGTQIRGGPCALAARGRMRVVPMQVGTTHAISCTATMASSVFWMPYLTLTWCRHLCPVPSLCRLRRQRKKQAHLHHHKHRQPHPAKDLAAQQPPRARRGRPRHGPARQP